MQFKLIKDGDGVRKHDISTIKEAIYSLTDNPDSFIILEPKTPIDHSIYLQAVKQEDLYIAEIRFVFNSDEDYKHYSCVFENKEDLFAIFSEYYLNERIPDIKEWKDESTTFRDETEDEMVKLYKEVKGITHYFEIWLNDDEISLTIHNGVLGETGETEEVIYDEEGDLPVKVAMAKLITTQKSLGYTDRVLTELIVQFSYNEKENMQLLLQKREHIESLLNDCLGWTGNGHCDGADIGSGTTNLFCYVVDKDIATKTILEVLIEEGYFEGVKIAYADEQTEEYSLLYPKNGSFSLI